MIRHTHLFDAAQANILETKLHPHTQLAQANRVPSELVLRTSWSVSFGVFVVGEATRDIGTDREVCNQEGQKIEKEAVSCEEEVEEIV